MFARTYLTLWEENHRFSPIRMTLLYSLFRLEVTLENRLYCYFCEAAMTMMLIYLSKCVTLVCNHIDCELSLIFFFDSVVDREHAWAEALKLFSLAARGSEARRYDRLRSKSY